MPTHLLTYDLPAPWGHLQYLTHQRQRNPVMAWLAVLLAVEFADEREPHMLSFAHHAAAFF